MENKSCCCGGENKLVISCSGAADVGQISDLVARKLGKSGNRKMTCLALFAVCDKEMIDDFKSQNILVIDGCNVDCGKKVMIQRGIESYEHLRITDLGYTKGETPANEEIIGLVTEKAEYI